MEIIEFTFQFKLGEEVYLKTDEHQLKRIVTCLNIAGGSMNSKLISYELSQGDTHSDHYESEITKDLDKLSKLGL
jgi:hypothetical protein